MSFIWRPPTGGRNSVIWRPPTGGRNSVEQEGPATSPHSSAPATAPPLSRARAWWPSIRAALVSIHILAIGIAAIPAPVGGMNRASWSEPTVQAEFETWSRVLGIPKDDLEDGVWAFARRWMDARRQVMRPVGRYLDVTGTDQPWRMFVAPHRFPSKYQVQARTTPVAAALTPGETAIEEGWETLFEERSREHRWHESFFEQERVRSILFRYSWPEYGYDAKRTCEYLAREIFAERAELDEVRCRFWKAQSPSARQVRAGTELPGGKWTQNRFVKRSVLEREAAR